MGYLTLETSEPHRSGGMRTYTVKVQNDDDLEAVDAAMKQGMIRASLRVIRRATREEIAEYEKWFGWLDVR